MPDDVRVPYRPEVRLEVPREKPRGFTAGNTSGLSTRELEALNRAPDRLMAAGMTEGEAKVALDAAVREWLEPRDAAEADIRAASGASV